MPWGGALALLAIFVCITWLWTTMLPMLARNVVPADGNRNGVLDGFRGLLASSVMLHHGIVVQYGAAGKTTATLGLFDLFLGRGAVAFFFMASAALFVDQIARQRAGWSLTAFFLGRVRRLVPLYAAAVAAAVVIVSFEAGGVEAPLAFAMGAARWMLFDFVARPDLNGVSGSVDYLGPAWSLRYEWMLYALLPTLAIAYRRTGRIEIVYAGLALASIPVHLFALFVAGALAVPASRTTVRHADAVIGILAVVGIGAAFLVLDEFASARAAPLLFPAFVLVLRGRSSLVLWLSTTPMRFLGQVSYSLYLLHSVVLLTLVKHVDVVRTVLMGGGVGFAIGMSMAFAGMLALSTLTYLAIERPFTKMKSFPLARPVAISLSSLLRPLAQRRERQLDSLPPEPLLTGA